MLDDLRHQAEQRHLTFGPDPATHNRNTLGGMIGNNSCGMHAQMAGKVEENTLELEILTYDGLRMWVGPTREDELGADHRATAARRGEIYAALKAIRDRYADEIRKRFPHIPRLVSGYPLHAAAAGARLQRRARARRHREHVRHGARGEAAAGAQPAGAHARRLRLRRHLRPPADHVPFCNAHRPIALEGIDSSMFTYMHDKGMSTSGRAMFPDGNAWLVVEFGGESEGRGRRSRARS